ncbi:MAG: hypothetical protein ABIK65_00255 [Candidatus Eisenbacteria bacterium]
MRYRSTAGRTILLGAALVFLAGCGKKGGGEGKEIKTIPDSLQSFSQKIEWLIPKSFESLEYACLNKADMEIDAAINLNRYVPPAVYFDMFRDISATHRNLYYGWEGFSAVYPIDPSLPVDSTLTLMQLEARSRLTEQIRLVEEQVSNITDEVQRNNVEKDLEAMKQSLDHVESEGVSLYGGEVRAFPEDLKSLMFLPEGLIRVIFPGVPSEGSWVRMSPFRFEKSKEMEQAPAQVPRG